MVEETLVLGEGFTPNKPASVEGNVHLRDLKALFITFTKSKLLWSNVNHCPEHE